MGIIVRGFYIANIPNLTEVKYIYSSASYFENRKDTLAFVEFYLRANAILKLNLLSIENFIPFPLTLGSSNYHGKRNLREGILREDCRIIPKE